MFSPGRIARDSFSATKVDTQQLDAKIASFFYENSLPFNIASSPSSAAMIKSSFNFRQHNPLKSYEVVEGEIVQLMHDKDLKIFVAAMKPEARTKFAEILKTVRLSNSGRQQKH